MKTLLFIAKKYWLGNKKQLLQLCTVITLSTAALFCACLYGRSSMVASLEQRLDQHGDFDYSVYYPDEEIAAVLEGDTRFTESAKIFRIGSMAPTNGGVVMSNPQTAEDASYRMEVGFFENERASDMFHLPLTGRYPEKTGEICIDKMTLQGWGYGASVGQQIPLTFYDENGIYVGEREYTLTGIIELRIPSTYGSGSIRYQSIPIDQYFVPPFIYLSQEEGLTLAGDDLSDFIFLGNITPFAYTAYKDPVYYTETFDTVTMAQEMHDRFGYRIASWNLPIDRYGIAADLILQFVSGYGITSYYLAEQAMSERPLEYDFFNGFLIPCFTVLLIILTVCSIYSILGQMMQKRSRQFGILRCVGMSLRQLTAMLIAEFSILLTFCIALGYFLGAGIYAGTLKLQEVLFHQKVYYAFALDEFYGYYIRKVTYSPALLPWLTVLLAVLAVLIIYLGKYLRKNPLSMLFSERKGTISRKHSRRLSASLMGGRHIGLVFLLSLSMAAVIYGAFSARVEADKEADISGYNYLVSQLGGENYDYVAALNVTSTMLGYNQLLHRRGISPEQAAILTKDEGVSEYILYAAGLGTKLVYDREDEKSAFLAEGSNRYCEDGLASGDPRYSWMTPTELKKEIFTFTYQGFSNAEGIYQTPTLGFMEEQLSLFEPYLVAGEINLEKIASGEEVILLAENTEVCDYFSIGEILPMADVVFGEWDGNEVLPEAGVPEGAQILTLIAGQPFYVFGERMNFSPRVGAIAILDEEMAAILTPRNTTVLPESGVKIATTLEAMQSWGLPNRNYTNLHMNLKKDADLASFEHKWYTAASLSEGVEIYCLPEIRAKMLSEIRASMLIFYFLMILLAVIGGISIYNLITVILYNARKKFAIVRAVGGSREMLFSLILKTAALYPLFAGIISGLIFYGYAGFCTYARNLSIRDELLYPNYDWPNAWYRHVPRQGWQFLQYAPHWFLLTMFCIVMAAMLLFTAKQLRALLHQNLPDELVDE